jgi:hypothetical protein
VDPVALAQAGPVAILLIGIGLLFRSFIKGDIVPGFIYRLEQEQRIKAETQAERNADSIAELAKAATVAHESRAKADAADVLRRANQPHADA